MKFWLFLIKLKKNLMAQKSSMNVTLYVQNVITDGNFNSDTIYIYLIVRFIPLL